MNAVPALTQLTRRHPRSHISVETSMKRHMHQIWQHRIEPTRVLTTHHGFSTTYIEALCLTNPLSSKMATLGFMKEVFESFTSV